jgi:mannose-6-phosphate isomerase
MSFSASLPPNAAFATWATDVLMPMWRDQGTDPRTGFAVEALDRARNPVVSGFHRTMVAARLGYFYARCAARQPQDARWRELAATQIGLLDGVFRDARHGSWHYSVKPDGTPQDDRKDLYTHAFAIFALAEYAGLTGDDRWLERADEALAELDRFAAPQGGWWARLSADFQTGIDTPAQNPLMHCFEAVCHLHRHSAAPSHLARLTQIADVMQTQFAAPERDRILELPIGTPDNRVEAGHQFEWFSLAAASPLAEPLGVAPGGLVHAMLQRALNEGLTAEGLVPLACSPDYATVKDPVHRVWTQLEFIRAAQTAHRLSGDASFAAARDRGLDALLTHFLQPDGWFEVVHAGKVLRAEQPGSSPYHFMTCIDDLYPA